jgi:hypothetical protein
MAVALFDAIAFDSAAVTRANVVREQSSAARQATGADQSLTAALRAVEDSLNAIVGQGDGGGGRRGGGGRGRGGAGGSGPTLSSMSGELQRLMSLLEEADVEPTTQAVAATQSALKTQANLAARWKTITTVAIPALNAKLRAARLSEIR